MTKIRAIIVDDELLARENLALLLNEFCPEVEIVGKGENVEQARQLIAEKKPEAVFLDIRMPSGEEGLELLEDVKTNNFQIVFVTALKDYAVKAFNINSIHYILKPIDIEDLKDAVEKLMVDWHLYENGWHVVYPDGGYKNKHLFYYLQQMNGYGRNRPKELEYFN